jgi:hypothetical protein
VEFDEEEDEANVSGVYRFGTRTVEVAGITRVKTIALDNKLRLVVTVV